MSQVPPQLPPPTNPALAPILGTVVYLAALIGVWGGLSLLLDRDVVDYPDAGPLLGPAMAVVACAVTWLVSWWVARKGHPLRGAVIAASGSYVGMLVVALIGHSTMAVAHFAISPFVIAAALLSPLVIVGTWALTRTR
jgi:hypothetical protein